MKKVIILVLGLFSVAGLVSCEGVGNRLNLINDFFIAQRDNLDLVKDFKKDLGPLGGVLTAMKWAKDNNKDYQWISTFPADTPFFKNQILKDFLKNINQDEDKLFFIKSNNTRHNIFGIWSIDLIDKLEEDLTRGERKVEFWANSVGVKNIEMEFDNKDPFFNINTKEDLKRAIENL